MADTAVAPAPAASPKKAKKTAAKKPATTATSKANHPPMAKMVTSAIEALNEKKGSSLAAIKKYIVGHYALDIEKQAKYINKALKAAIEKQVIVVRGHGNGLNNRFRLGKPAVKTTKKTKTTKKPAVEKSTTAKVKKPKVAAKKEQAKVEKTVKKTAKKKPAAEKKVTTPKKAKPAKVKTGGKSPVAVKAPKPKKSTATKAKPSKK